jgi:hypothetical protein
MQPTNGHHPGEHADEVRIDWTATEEGSAEDAALRPQNPGLGLPERVVYDLAN